MTLSNGWTRLLLAIVLAGCAACSSGEPTGGDGLQIVATTTILGDVVRNIAGEDAAIEVLLPRGADPHDYQASARQVSAMQNADLVVANGLMLEESLADILDGAASDGANILMLAELLDPLPYGGADGNTFDPHVWLDPIRMANAAAIVADALSDLDDTVDWSARSDVYVAELMALDEEVRDLLSGIPAAERLLVTNHDSLGYFAERYEFEIVGTVIPGGATLADPSSAEMADLVMKIEELGVAAIFAETTEATTLAETIAAEVGEDVPVVVLYTGSLGEPGSGADTLIGMVRTDAQRIAAALTTP